MKWLRRKWWDLFAFAHHEHMVCNICRVNKNARNIGQLSGKYWVWSLYVCRWCYSMRPELVKEKIKEVKNES